MMTEKEIESFLGELDNGRPTKGEAAVKKVRFPPLDSLKQEKPIKTSLGHLEDVRVTLSAVLGDKVLKFREILNLDVDSVISLDKSAGDTINIYINEQETAKGEVIIVNDSFAVRVIAVNPSKNVRRESK